MRYPLPLLCAIAASTASAWAQPAPAPYRVTPFVRSSPQEVIQFKAGPGDIERFSVEGVGPMEDLSAPWTMVESVRRDGAAWLQIRFQSVRLGNNSRLVIRSKSDDGSQTFDSASLPAWSNRSAMFNGEEVQIFLNAASGDEQVSYRIDEVVRGEQIISIGDDESLAGAPEALCGIQDDRVPSSDPRVGRIMPVGCTGWLIADDVALTAGHCHTSGMQILQFGVPESRSDGTPVMPAPERQYPILTPIASHDFGVGHDWAVFRVGRNSESGLLPGEAQGGFFQLSQTLEPERVQVAGYGIDDKLPGPAAPFFRNSSSQTQQMNQGPFLGMLSSPHGLSWLGHQVDTEAGNSGGPIIALDDAGQPTDIAVGIHTHAGCDPHLLHGNKGTPFANAALWKAIQAALEQP